MPYPTYQTRPDRTPRTGQHAGSRRNADAHDARSADEHDYDAFMSEQDPLDIDAATWVARKHSGLTHEEHVALDAWLNANMRHRQAFDDMADMLGAMQQLPDDAVNRLKAATPSNISRPAAGYRKTANELKPVTHPARRVEESWRRHLASRFRPTRMLASKVFTGAVVTALIAGGAITWNTWHQQPIFTETYATQRGQLLNATLPDTPDRTYAQGTSLHLDTSTHAKAQLYRDRREVHLLSGQAMFAVHRDSARPFHVYSGGLKITVLGTRFSVRHTPTGLHAGQTVIAVEEGQVSVQTVRLEGMSNAAIAAANTAGAHPAGRIVNMTAGQTVMADARGHLGPVTESAVETLVPWRSGRVNFIQTPLAEAIAEFERYGATSLIVRDPVLAALPVGGSYSLSRWQSFAQTLPSVLPVRLIRRGDVTEVVAR